MMHLYCNKTSQQFDVILESIRFPKLHMGLDTLPPNHPYKALALLPASNVLMFHVLNDPATSARFCPFCLLLDDLQQLSGICLELCVLGGQVAGQDFCDGGRGGGDSGGRWVGVEDDVVHGQGTVYYGHQMFGERAIYGRLYEILVSIV